MVNTRSKHLPAAALLAFTPAKHKLKQGAVKTGLLPTPLPPTPAPLRRISQQAACVKLGDLNYSDLVTPKDVAFIDTPTTPMSQLVEALGKEKLLVPKAGLDPAKLSTKHSDFARSLLEGLAAVACPADPQAFIKHIQGSAQVPDCTAQVARLATKGPAMLQWAARSCMATTMPLPQVNHAIASVSGNGIGPAR